MAWGKETRREVYERQQGLCAYCQQPLNGPFVLHHVRNRKNGGQSTSANAQARHPECETYCHANFKDGNPWQDRPTPKPFNKKMKRHYRLRGDKRPFQVYLAIMDEQYAFRMYCTRRA